MSSLVASGIQQSGGSLDQGRLARLEAVEYERSREGDPPVSTGFGGMCAPKHPKTMKKTIGKTMGKYMKNGVLMGYMMVIQWDLMTFNGI